MIFYAKNGYLWQNFSIMEKTYIIKGMGCEHCRKTVEKVIRALKGCESVHVDLSRGTAHVSGNVSAADVAKAVTTAGFEFIGESRSGIL